MEAYLDGLAQRERDSTAFDVLIDEDCNIPQWLYDDDCFTFRHYDLGYGSGRSLIQIAADGVRSYLSEHDPDEIRQITQPRWHAPGILLGSRGESLRRCTRVSHSNFTEYQTTTGVERIREFGANNVIGQAIFLADAVYTPEYGGVSLPWWSRSKLIEEPRVAGRQFRSDVDPLESLFTQDTRRVLTVGRVSEKKGIDLLLDTALELPDWEFVVVGPLREDELVDRAGDITNVTLYGPLDYIEMPRAYAACNVLLSTSRVEWGGISRAMLEAHAVDRPIVALDIEDAASIATVTVDSTPCSVATGLQTAIA
jgi:glycosyltransferase involved in cell wall biosynthesis